MSERHLYDNDSQFKGSIDDDGRIYDATHRYIGRIENGTVYDYRDIPQGTVRENGMVMDYFRQEVGQSFGTGFSGPASVSREEMGRVRADIASQGRGSDYGAFLLADRARGLLGTCDEDMDDGAMDDEDDDDSFDSDPWEPHHPRRSNDVYDSASQGDQMNGCGGAIGCLGLVVLVIVLLIRSC